MLPTLKARCCLAMSSDVQFPIKVLNDVHQSYDITPLHVHAAINTPVSHKLTQSCDSGDQSQQYVVDFDEKSGPDPLGDMLMKVSGVPI